LHSHPRAFTLNRTDRLNQLKQLTIKHDPPKLSPANIQNLEAGMKKADAGRE